MEAGERFQLDFCWAAQLIAALARQAGTGYHTVPAGSEKIFGGLTGPNPCELPGTANRPDRIQATVFSQKIVNVGRQKVVIPKGSPRLLGLKFVC